MTTPSSTPNRQQPEIAVVIQGGLVSAVVTTNPRFIGLAVKIIDYDTDGADPDRLEVIEQQDGSVTNACVSEEEIEAACIEF